LATDRAEHAQPLEGLRAVWPHCDADAGPVIFRASLDNHNLEPDGVQRAGRGKAAGATAYDCDFARGIHHGADSLPQRTASRSNPATARPLFTK
jgi:hypothetical protein